MKPEARLQADVAALLRLRRDLWFTHPANEGVRSPRTGAFLKKLGMTPGAPDLVGVLDGGRMFGIELKAGRNSTTPEQDAALAAIERQGGVVGVARSIDDVLRILKDAMR